MNLVPMYDDATIAELAHDLSEQIILPSAYANARGIEDAYVGVARKLYAAGWRKPDKDDWATGEQD